MKKPNSSYFRLVSIIDNLFSFLGATLAMASPAFTVYWFASYTFEAAARSNLMKVLIFIPLIITALVIALGIYLGSVFLSMCANYLIKACLPKDHPRKYVKYKFIRDFDYEGL